MLFGCFFEKRSAPAALRSLESGDGPAGSWERMPLTAAQMGQKKGGKTGWMAKTCCSISCWHHSGREKALRYHPGGSPRSVHHSLRGCTESL